MALFENVDNDRSRQATASFWSSDFWNGYYEHGIIPNIWKGITGQTSADRNADKANALNKQVADENLAFQKENLEYQKALQQQIFEREDTSYQRTAQDMLAAGLNPLSMAGTDGSGQVVSTNPLNNGIVYQKADTMNPNEAISGLSSLISEIDSIRTGKLERDSLQSQIDRQNLENFAFAKKNGIKYNPKNYSNDNYLDEYAQADLNALNRSNTSDVEKYLTLAEELLLDGRGEEIVDKVKNKYPNLKNALEIVQHSSTPVGRSKIVGKVISKGIEKTGEYLKNHPDKLQNDSLSLTSNTKSNAYSNANDFVLNKISPNKRHRTETQSDFMARMFRNSQKKKKNK